MKDRKMRLRKQTKVWTTKDGRKVRICDMTDDHLINSIKLLRRHGEAKLSYARSAIGIFGNTTAEMALVSIDAIELQLMDSDWQEFVPSIYDNLQQECFRRGLDDPNFQVIEKKR